MLAHTYAHTHSWMDRSKTYCFCRPSCELQETQWHCCDCSSKLSCPWPKGHFGIARSIRLSSVPWRSCLGYRHAGCLQLSHRQPPNVQTVDPSMDQCTSAAIFGSATRDVQTADPSADGCRSAMIFGLATRDVLWTAYPNPNGRRSVVIFGSNDHRRRTYCLTARGTIPCLFCECFHLHCF